MRGLLLGSVGEKAVIHRDVLRYSHLGLQFAIVVGVLSYVGYRLDLRWGTSPLLTLAGLALGFGAGFYSLYKGVYGVGVRRPPGDRPD